MFKRHFALNTLVLNSKILIPVNIELCTSTRKNVSLLLYQSAVRCKFFNLFCVIPAQTSLTRMIGLC